MSEGLGSKGDQGQDDNKKAEKEERRHENELKQDTSRPVLEHADEKAQARTSMDYPDLEISNIHYHGSLESFGTDDEVLKTIHDLQTSGSTSNSNSDGGCSASEYARTRSMTVVWEGGQWCCLEGRTLYILKAVGWTGRVRARVLVDQDSAGATL
ncbi:hypothetical protein BGZ47_007156 [Haplosporangium gracile]|nr:hypothetical protein BGZ47_007156 [Haplosporangium gracile]